MSAESYPQTQTVLTAEQSVPDGVVRLPRFTLSMLFLLITLGALLGSFYAAVLRTISEHYYVSQIVISPDLKWIARDSTRGLVVFDLETGKMQLACDGDAGVPVFSLDGAQFVFVQDGQVNVWETKNWSRLKQFPAIAEPRMTALSTDGGRILVEDYGTVEIFDLTDGTRISTSKIQEGFAYNIIATPDLSHLAVYDGATINIWDVSAGKQVLSLSEFGHDTIVGTQLAFSDNGRKIATRVDHSVQVWNRRTGSIVAAITTGDPFIVGFSPSGQLLAVLDWGGAVQVVDMGTRKVRTLGQLQRHSAEAVAFSRDGTRLAVADRHGNSATWDIESGLFESRQSGLFLSPPAPTLLWWTFGAVGTVWLVLWWRIRRQTIWLTEDGKTRRKDLGWYLVLLTAIVVIGNGLSLLPREITESPIQLVWGFLIVELTLLVAILISLIAARYNLFCLLFSVFAIIACILIDSLIFIIAIAASA